MKARIRRNLPLLLVVSVLLGLVTYGAAKQDSALPTGSWGLSFRTEGEPPVGNADSASLQQYDAAYIGDTKEKVIYLTFDAGYENGCTAQILDVLKQHGVKAAFFLVGNYMEQNSELVKRMTEEGHIVGNHTYHHWDMSRIGDRETFREELQSLETLYTQITGQTMQKYYRPPQGIYSEENLRMAQELGYRTVFWSLAYVDWLNDRQPTSEEAFSKLIPRIHSGAIVLLHSTSKTNAAILDDLLTQWEALGYRFGTLDEVFSGRQ
ncbi:MAG: delta-lactam-biosynthetic de-N-acetylase [Oscillospiraceae bacterium]|nr:delta-lactam-biosynthetic de-N-acetylase [Oscillospiraceae bacterium]